MLKERQKGVAKSNAENSAKDISVISLAWDLGWMIAVPIVVFAVGGALLDKQFETSPWFLLGGIGMSLIITAVMIYYKVIGVLTELSGEIKQSGGENKKN